MVFNNHSFSLPHNRVIGLLGENGIGKTTLLRLIAGVIKPDSGKVYIDDQVVSQKTKLQVSFLLAPSNLYVFMRVKDAVQYYKDFHPDFDFDTASGCVKNLHWIYPVRYRTFQKAIRNAYVYC